MLVGPDGTVAEKVQRGFAQALVHIVRVYLPSAACEALPVAMPQVVIVIGSLKSDERDALSDRATAVGALVVDVDPDLDDESLEALIGRAATAAITKKLLSDESGPAGASSSSTDAEDEAEEDIDSKW
jgi:hypothetical protein